MKRAEFISLLLAAIEDRKVLDFAIVDSFNTVSSLEFINVIRSAKENGISDDELLALAKEHHSRLDGDLQALQVKILENTIQSLTAELTREKAFHERTICQAEVARLETELVLLETQRSLYFSKARLDVYKKFEDVQATRLEEQLNQADQLRSELQEVKSSNSSLVTTLLLLFVSGLLLLPIGGMICYYEGVTAGQSNKR